MGDDSEPDVLDQIDACFDPAFLIVGVELFAQASDGVNDFAFVRQFEQQDRGRVGRLHGDKQKLLHRAILIAPCPVLQLAHRFVGTVAGLLSNHVFGLEVLILLPFHAI